MPLFAVFGLDHSPHSMEKRDALRAEHRAYVKQHRAPIALAAPFLDSDNNQCGSFYIFEMNDELEIREWLKDEPFHANGVYKDVIIRRFEVGQNRLAQKGWPDVS